MRLDDFDNSINVEDQRGGGGARFSGPGGKIGCGSLVIALIGGGRFRHQSDADAGDAAEHAGRSSTGCVITGCIPPAR